MQGTQTVITSSASFSSLGTDSETFWQRARDGISGIVPITTFETGAASCRQAGEISAFKARDFLPRKGLKYMGRGINLALAAAESLLTAGGLDPQASDRSRFAVTLGTNWSCVSNMYKFDRKAMEGFADPLYFPNTGVSAPACQISIKRDLHGLTLTFSNGVGSALDAVDFAARELRRGKVDVAIAGGVEELAALIFHGAEQHAPFHPDETPWPGPFHRGSRGQIMGEGCGLVLLERAETAQARGADVQAVLLGYGACFDPAPLSGGDPDPELQASLIEETLARAQLQAGDIDLVISAASGVPSADLAEATALARVFGDRGVPVFPLAGLTGNTYGAAGGLAMVTALASMKAGCTPGLPGDGSTAYPIDLITTSRSLSIQRCLITGFGENGDRSVLILGHPDALTTS